jgi:hypothetical protein
MEGSVTYGPAAGKAFVVETGMISSLVILEDDEANGLVAGRT